MGDDMAGMSRKEISRLLDHIEPQGVQLTRTTKGILLRLPNGQTSMLHFTGSDSREGKNVRAALKRAGITWPTDGGTDLRKDVTEHPPRDATIERILPLLEKWEHRYITAAQLMRLHAAEIGPKPALTQLTAQRVLYHSGWIATGKSTARKWLRPLELEPDRFEEETPEAPQSAPTAPEPPAPVGEVADTGESLSDGPTGLPVAEPVQQTPTEAPPASADGREFLDTADSWVVEDLPPNMPISEVFRALRSFGLEGEIRVWRQGR